MSSALKLYGFPLSQPTRSIKLLCTALKIPYELHVVDALKGENTKAPFLKINPAGLVPCIQDEHGVLGESGAILQYLCESKAPDAAVAALWYPPAASAPAARAQCNHWMHWHHSNSRYATHTQLVPLLFPNLKTAEETRRNGARDLNVSLKYLENTLATRTYVAGSSHPTIADLLIVTEFDQHLPEAFAGFDLTPFTHIGRWMKQLRSELVGYEEVFAPVIEMANKTKAAAAARASKL